MTDLSFHVRQFVPHAAGEELEHRAALLEVRDWAAALRGRTESLTAFNLAVEAHERAGGSVFAVNESVRRLAKTVKATRFLIHAAILIEQLDRDEAARG